MGDINDSDFTVCGTDRSYPRTPAIVIMSKPGDPAAVSHLYKALSEDRAIRPDEGYYHLGPSIALNASFIAGKDGTMLRDCVADIQVGQELHNGIMSAPRLKPSDLGGDDALPYVLVSKPGFRNYGHFLTDIAPKLINMKRADIVQANVILSEDSRKFVPILEILSCRVGLYLNFVFCRRGHAVDSTGLIYFGPIQKHGRLKSKTLIEARDEILRDFRQDHKRQDRRLFVMRKEDETRSFVRQGEIEDVAKNFGFECIYPQDYTWREQVTLFSEASHIIGGLGAGLTNMLFAPPGAKVMMIDPGTVGFYFWDLACLAQQDFTFLFADSVVPFNLEKASQRVDLEPKLLEAALPGFMGSDAGGGRIVRQEN